MVSFLRKRITKREEYPPNYVSPPSPLLVFFTNKRDKLGEQEGEKMRMVKRDDEVIVQVKKCGVQVGERA